MKHLGDISKISGAAVAPVDIVTFGSPCQDLSVAGKQAGLQHNDLGDEGETRSGLFMEAVRIIKEMREATNGQQPRFAVWENVPGAFSSNKGADFQTVLRELCQITEPKAPAVPIPQAGWPPAGQLTNVGAGSLAWRTIDAQFHGVPQRRRRIILVCDFAGQCAGDLLFKPGGLPGYPAPGVCEGEIPAGAAAICADRAVIGFNGRQDPISGPVAGALGATSPQAQCVAFSYKASPSAGSIGFAHDTAPTLLGERNDAAICYTIDAFASNSMKSANPHSGYHETQIARCLDTTSSNPTCAQGGNVIVEAFAQNQCGEVRTSAVANTLTTNGNASGRNSPLVATFTQNQREEVRDLGNCAGTLSANHGTHQQTYVLQGSMIGRADDNGPRGGGISENTSFTLTATDRHAILIENHPQDSRVNINPTGVVQTLPAQMGTGGGVTCH